MRRRFCFTVLLSFLFALNIPAQTAEADNVIARVWLQRAAELIGRREADSIDWDSVSRSLDTAREFGAAGSDFLYLNARLLLSLEAMDPQEPGLLQRREAFEMLGLALDSLGPADIIGFSEKARVWSGLALRLREYRALLERFDEWPLGEQYDPVLLYAAGRSALYLGYEDFAAELALKGESLSLQKEMLPDTRGDLSVLSPAFEGTPHLRFRALAVAAGHRKSIESLNSASSTWGEGLEEALRPWILSGHIDIRSDLFPLSAFSSEVGFLRDVINGGGAGIPEAHHFDLALIRNLRNDGVEVVLSDGVYEADEDYDGYIEEQLTIDGGVPVYRFIDSDQDGNREWSITYNEGKPVRIVAENGQLIVNYKEQAWPEVRSIYRNEGPTDILIDFLPGSYTWDPWSRNPLWTDPSGRPEPNASFWEAAASVTVNHIFSGGYDFATETGQGGTRGMVVTYLSGGYPILAREFRYTDDENAVLLWVRELLYDEGEVIAGRRSFREKHGSRADPGERLWELYERYESGVLVGLAWDPDMIGTPAYLSDWALERVLEVQAWDVNQDGWIDFRRFVLPDNRTTASELLITEAESADLLPWAAAQWYPWDL